MKLVICVTRPPGRYRSCSTACRRARAVPRPAAAQNLRPVQRLALAACGEDAEVGFVVAVREHSRAGAAPLPWTGSCRARRPPVVCPLNWCPKSTLPRHSVARRFQALSKCSRDAGAAVRRPRIRRPVTNFATALRPASRLGRAQGGVVQRRQPRRYISGFCRWSALVSRKSSPVPRGNRLRVRRSDPDRLPGRQRRLAIARVATDPRAPARTAKACEYRRLLRLTGVPSARDRLGTNRRGCGRRRRPGAGSPRLSSPASRYSGRRVGSKPAASVGRVSADQSPGCFSSGCHWRLKAVKNRWPSACLSLARGVGFLGGRTVPGGVDAGTGRTRGRRRRQARTANV